MPDPSGAPLPSPRDVRVATWRTRLIGFVAWAMVNAGVFFGLPYAFATNFDFDIPVIDARTGQDVGIQYDEFIDHTRKDVGWWLLAFNVIALLLLWSRRRKRTS